MTNRPKGSSAVLWLSVALLLLILAVGGLFLFRPQITEARRIAAEEALISLIESGSTDLSGVALPEMEGEEYEEAYELEGSGLGESGSFVMAQSGTDAAGNSESGDSPSGSDSLLGSDSLSGSDFLSGYGTLSIPAIDLKMALLRGADQRQLRCGAGWLPASAEIGAPGNCVILGHRMKAYGRHFNRADELAAGHEITITLADGTAFTYVVTESLVILPQELSQSLSAFTGGYNLTLVTCTPTGVSSHRLLVRATLSEESLSATLEHIGG